ncbi:hypothetical protein TAGGR_1732 [Thermodesulfovibrio aggregans]|uniref:Adenylyl-sulfate kinase n=1 Tax=Thermodesulfovibrio aggregans TaxID=86166 RepID=A0A0U9HNV5_9BACT|nr:hypothetical protein TAGGR_1732 [Thermodesulfovibrio aggregans]
MNVEFKNNKGFCIWLIGLPCVGKTTLVYRERVYKG